MAALEALLQQYSIEAIILLLVGVVVAFKFLSELWDWGYGRIRKHFNIQTEKQQQDEQDRTEIKNLQEDFKKFMVETKESRDKTEEQIEDLIKQQSRFTDRLQENTRSFIIDKHHYFCYQIKAIDDMNLQSLERRYMYYKADDGDSYIDQLMEELRELPRVNLQNTIQGIERDVIT